MEASFAQSLTDILADLIIAEASLKVIETGASAKTGEAGYLGREALYKYAKRALPAVAEAIKYLVEFRTGVETFNQSIKERDSDNGGEIKNETDTILRDDAEA